MSLYAKRLEKGRFIWPSPTAGVVGISASQLAYMLDGIDWRNPVHDRSAQDSRRPLHFLGPTASICDSMVAWILAVISPMTSTR